LNLSVLQDGRELPVLVGVELNIPEQYIPDEQALIKLTE
jgi:hypothetical protein